MATSKTQINKRMKGKTNSHLAEAIFLAKKNNSLELANALARPTREMAEVNLSKLNETKASTVIVPGKVLSSGEITKKIKVYAVSFSENAAEKLKKAGCEAKNLFEALKNLKKGEKLTGEIIK